MQLYFDTKENKAISALPDTKFKLVNDDFSGFCISFECNEDDIIIINADMIHGEAVRYSDFSGILLLKWLRIYKKLTNKIIVFGLMPLKSIVELHPEHIILMAKGTSYLEFPFTKEELDKTVLATRQIEKDKLVEDYKPFVKADFNIEQIGHSFANEFGLYLMQMMHHAITGKNLELKIQSTYNTLDFDKAFFLYSPSASAINWEHIKTAREDLKNIIEQQKILYIDDQASLGWDRLLCDMIYGSETNSGFVVLSNPNEFQENVTSTINREKPGCVLLDLRLKGDSEVGLPVEKISGFELLKIIKSKFPALPVIIISATNKADSLSALIKAGADGLWTKPRVEFIHHDAWFSDSYINLLHLVYRALTKYKTPLEETIFKLGFQETLSVSINTVDDFFSKSKFIFDTNYFICDNEDYDNYYSRLYHFILLCNYIEHAGKGKRIIISQDVLFELFLKSRKKFTTSATQKDYDVKFSSKYALDLIFRISNSASKVIETNFFLENQLKNASVSYDISKSPSGKRFILSKNRVELIDYFSKETDAEQTKKIIDKKHKLGILHADDTLKLLANYYFMKEKTKEINNIYFISNDLYCNYNVCNFIKKSNFWTNFDDNTSMWLSNKNKDGEIRLYSAAFGYKKSGIGRNIFIFRGTKFIAEFQKIIT